MIKAGNKVYNSPHDLPEVIPVFPLSGALLLPSGNMPLNIFEPRYIELIDDAIFSDKIVGMIQPCWKSRHTDSAPVPLSKIGCLGRITAVQETGDGCYLLNLTGICRYSVIEEVASNKSYRTCRVEVFSHDFDGSPCESNKINRNELLEAFRAYLKSNNLDVDWETIGDTDDETLVTALCMMSPYEPAEKQALLEAPDLKTRTDTLIAISQMHLARQDRGDRSSLQ